MEAATTQQTNTTIGSPDSNNVQDTVKESLMSHGKSSYYTSDFKLSQDAKNLIKTDILLANSEGPKLLDAKPLTKPEPRASQITKYDFMNDGPWMKVIIDTEKNP